LKVERNDEKIKSGSTGYSISKMDNL
jgi:hypothetical protein